MKIVFIHGHLALGGIETLMLKLAREFQRAGHAVTIVAGEGGNAELEARLREHAQLRFFPIGVIRGFPKWRAMRRLDIADADVFFAFGGAQLLTAAMLRQRLAPRARLVTGVFSPWEYFPAPAGGRHDWALVDAAFAALPDENVIIMSEACRTEHQRALGRTFERSPTIPLPIDLVPPRSAADVDRSKIVSIGRIVDFKPYTFHMLGVVASLLARGHDVTYHVYGDGAAFGRLADEVAQRRLGSHVVLHGTIDYHDIPSVLRDAGVYVGVGTAALEAAALGVPTVVAYESPEPLCLGLIDETIGSEVGEVLSRGARYPLLERIEGVLTASPDAYASMGRRGVEHVRSFATPDIARRYVEAFAGAADADFRVTPVDFLRGVGDWTASRVRAAVGGREVTDERYFKRITPAGTPAG